MNTPTLHDVARAICCPPSASRPHGGCISPEACYAEDRSRSYPVQMYDAAVATSALFTNLPPPADTHRLAQTSLPFPSKDLPMRSHHFAVRHFSPSTLAAHIRYTHYTLEFGWSNIFGESWENAWKRLQDLPSTASEEEVSTAVGFSLLLNLPELICASCISPTSHLVNLGRASATFWLCVRCLEDGQAALVGEKTPNSSSPFEGNFF